MKQRVLILCTGNSARSQMAEGLLRQIGGDPYEVHSAGIRPVGVNPLAVEAMGEIAVKRAAFRSARDAVQMRMREFLIENKGAHKD